MRVLIVQLLQEEECAIAHFQADEAHLRSGRRCGPVLVVVPGVLGVVPRVVGAAPQGLGVVPRVLVVVRRVLGVVRRVLGVVPGVLGGHPSSPPVRGRGGAYPA